MTLIDAFWAIGKRFYAFGSKFFKSYVAEPRTTFVSYIYLKIYNYFWHFVNH